MKPFHCTDQQLYLHIVNKIATDTAFIPSNTTNSSDPMDDEFQSPDVPVYEKLSYLKNLW